MKKILMMTLFAIAALAAYSQEYVTVIVADASGTPTNIRNAPNGKVVCQLDPLGSYTVDLISVKNGWWRISPEVEEWGDDEKTIPLKGSKTGYWIHQSVLDFGIAGDQDDAVHVAPSEKSKLVKLPCSQFDMTITPVEKKGSWLKFTAKNGKNTITGWIHNDRICSNPLTTCP